MADRIAEPAGFNPATLDWQRMLIKAVASTGGFYLVDFIQNGITAPMVKQGSRFEVNGNYFTATVDEPIQGFDNVPVNSSAWAYAVPNQPGPGETSSCTFEYSTTAPVYDAALGGMFNGPNRCIGVLDRRASGYALWGVGITYPIDMIIRGVWNVPTPPMP